MTLVWKGWFLSQPLFFSEIPEAAPAALQKGGADQHHLCAAAHQDTSDTATQGILHLLFVLRMLICF